MTLDMHEAQCEATFNVNTRFPPRGIELEESERR